MEATEATEATAAAAAVTAEAVEETAEGETVEVISLRKAPLRNPFASQASAPHDRRPKCRN